MLFDYCHFTIWGPSTMVTDSLLGEKKQKIVIKITDRLALNGLSFFIDIKGFFILNHNKNDIKLTYKLTLDNNYCIC